MNWLKWLLLAPVLLLASTHAPAAAKAIEAEVMFVGVPADATYGSGEPLDFTVFFNDSIEVTGTPQLELDIGGKTVSANYSSGSLTQNIHFRYVVQPGDIDTDGITIIRVNLNGGTLSGDGIPAATTLTGLPPTSGILVAGSAPVSVPTLTEWAMILMGLALGMAAMFSLHRRKARMA